MKFNIELSRWILLPGLMLLAGCTAVNTFPAIARPGDTVSFMVGGSAKARQANLTAVLTDAGGNVFDLQALGMVRSVFNLRPDGRAAGLHYSNYLQSNRSWISGHEPLQTVMIADLPATVSTGVAKLTVTWTGVGDNSSDGGNPFDVALEIIPGTGTGDQFLRNDALGIQAADLSQLETAPDARVTFANNSTPFGSIFIGAASLEIDFDKSVVNPNDLDLYVPESTVRGSYTDSGAFGMTQRMVYWHQDGQKLYVDIIAPQGIDARYLQFYIVHPKGLSGSPAFNILNAHVYGTDGNLINASPVLTYSP